MYQSGKIVQLTIIALYLENGARYAHTYDGTLIGSCRWPIDSRSNDLVWPWRVGCQGSAFLDDLDFAPNDLERPNSARCHRWVRECFYGIRHAPNPKEVGAQCPKIFWDPYWYLYGFELVRAFHIWHDNTCGGGAFLWGQIHPFLRQQDLGAHKIFGIPYWCPYSLTYSDGTWHGKTSGGLLWFSQVPYPKGMGNGVGTNFGVGRRRGEARRAESGGGGSWGGDRQPSSPTRGFAEALSSLSGVRGEATAAEGFPCILSHQIAFLRISVHVAYSLHG